MADDFGQSLLAPNLGNLAVGGTATGNREDGNDRDWFRITLVAGQSYIFQANSTSALDPQLTLRDSNGIAVGGNDDANGGNNAQLNFRAPVGGTYYVDVGSVNGGAPDGLGAYTVSAAINPSPPTPPTDDYGAQTGDPAVGTIAIGTPASGTINYNGDEDWFAVTLTAGQAYIIRQNRNLPTDSLDPHLFVRDSIGNPLTSNDDGDNGTNSLIQFTPTITGTYYLDARSFQGSGTGAYTISIDFDGAPPPPPVDDYASQLGGTLGAVTVNGGTVSGNINFGGDHDWFAVTLAAGVTYRFNDNGVTLPDPRFSLRDSNGSLLPAGNDDFNPPNRNAQFDYTATYSGVHYIDANSPSNTETGTYTVSVTQLNTAPVLNPTATPVLTSVNENAGAPVGAVGTLVSSLVDLTNPAGGLDNVTDVDGPPLGIALTATNTTNGSWFYSINGGSNWNAMGAVNDGAARLLLADANTRLYFQPNPAFDGTISSAITFRAWDGSAGSNGGLASTSTNGGTSAFSTATDTANLTVIDVPTVSINSVSGPENSSPLIFTVSLSAPSTQTVTVNYATANGTASSASDYGATSGTVTFLPGETLKPVTVNITDDGVYEGAESFTVVLSAPTNATIATGTGTGTINNDDAAPVFNFSSATYSIAEGNAGTGLMTFTVTKTGATELASSVNYATSDGTATAGSDYVVTSGTLNFLAGQTSQTFSVAINGDTAVEANEAFTVTLSSPNFATLGATSTATATITNDDNAPPTATNLSAAETYTEDQLPLDLTNIVVTDTDSANVTVTLTLSNTAAGTLSTGTSTAVTSTFASGVWTASGATADVNALLAGVTFTPASNFNASFNLATSVSDGTSTITGTKAFTGIPVNDPPVNVPGAAASGNEDTSFALTGVSIADVDGGAGDTYTVLLTVQRGSLAIRTDVAGGITAANIISGNSGTNGITVTGTLAQINATLANATGLTYQGDLNFNGNDSLRISTWEGVRTDAAVIGSPSVLTTAAQPAHIVSGDINGDGRVDLVYALDTSGQVAYRLGNGNGTFGSETSLAGAFQASSVAVGDVDGDTIADIVVANYRGAASNAFVGVYYGTGGGAFGAQQSLGNLAQAYDVVLADMNNDGRMDIIGDRRNGGQSFVYLQTTTPRSFAAPAVYSNSSTNYTKSIITGDFNNDGLLDLVAVNPGDVTFGNPPGSVTIRLGTGGGALGTLVNVANSASTNIRYWEAAGADINNDGNLDLVVSSIVDFGGFTVYLGDGTGNFANGVQYATGSNTTGIQLRDINGDGIIDALFTTQGNPGATGYRLGNGEGTFQAAVTVAGGFNPESLAVADFDGDGDLDYASVAQSDGTLRIFLNGGTYAGDVDTRAITVNAVNDAPTATNLSAVESYVEDTQLDLTNIVITDVDNATVTATLTLSNALAGSLSTGTSGTVTSTFAAGVWTASGATADVNTLLAGVTFTPAANFNSNFTITTSVSDGAAAAVTGSKAFTGTSVNDAPSGANATLTILEDGVSTLTAADFGFTDPNDLPGNALLAVRITTLPLAGSLTLNNVAVNTDDFIPVADINAGLLQFRPATNGNGTGYASIGFAVQDNGSTANGGVDLDASPNTLTFDVMAVNDAPVGTAVTKTFSEDTNYTFARADFGFTDPNDTPANALAAVIIVSFPGSGTLYLDPDGTGSAPAFDLSLSGPGVSVSAADIDAGRLYYTPVANAVGSTTFNFWVQDDGGIANSGADTDTTGRVFTLTTASVNDAPAGTDAVLTILEDTPRSFTASDFGFTDVSDSPANALLGVVITTLPTAGTLTLNTFGLTAGDFVPVADLPNLVFTPALNANGSGYATFTFQVQDDGGVLNSGADIDPSANTIGFNVTSVNDAPAGSNANLSVVEGGSRVLTAADFGYSDVDGNAFTAIRISALPGAGQLTFDADGSGPGVPVSASVGQIVTIADINAGKLTYVTPSGVNNGATNFSFQVQDNGGTADGGIDLDASPNTISYTLTPVTPPGPPPPVTIGNTTYVEADYVQPANDPATVITPRNQSDNIALNITGNAGSETIIGNYGPNILTDGGGVDTLVGLLNNDTYVVSNSGTVVVENNGEGTDTVLTSTSYILPTGASIENLSALPASGTAPIFLTGNGADQRITGNAGDNIINGLGGSDTMVGLGGNDVYLVRGPGDVVIEANGEGTDTVYTTVSYNLGANEVEVLSTVTHTDTTPINLIGNYLSQTIIGNYGDNLLNGGSGIDTLVGLFGNDLYAVGDSRIVIVEAEGQGVDTVVTSVSYTLGTDVSAEVLSAQDRSSTTGLSLTGNRFNQTIAGTEGADTINGGAGSDVLIGGGGGDRFDFTTLLGSTNVDAITDFGTGDRIGLSSAIFGAIGGTLDAGEFVIGSAAADADDRIVYNQSTGHIFYDADGTGAGLATLFAVVTPGTLISASNFEVIAP